MSIDEAWNATGDLDPAGDMPAIDRVREFGAGEIRKARSMSTSWRWWADHLADLIARMPTDAPSPRWIDETGSERETQLGAGHVDPIRLRHELDRTVADADAMAATWQRAATQVEDRLRNVLDILRGNIHTDAQERVP